LTTDAGKTASAKARGGDGRGGIGGDHYFSDPFLRSAKRSNRMTFFATLADRNDLGYVTGKPKPLAALGGKPTIITEVRFWAKKRPHFAAWWSQPASGDGVTLIARRGAR